MFWSASVSADACAEAKTSALQMSEIILQCTTSGKFFANKKAAPSQALPLMFIG